MDRSLTYCDDVAAMRLSLQLMQKRSGVPLVRFTSTFEVLLLWTLYAKNAHKTWMLSLCDPDPVGFPVFLSQLVARRAR
jgi:hypothetical protein